jgi:SAM-dependent methyltransferase
MAVLQERFPNWRSLTIHESSPGRRGVSLRLAEQCARYIPSQFFHGTPLGSMVGEYRCENLEQLTFEDASIDLHITQDVMEHVWHPERAFAEIGRTLKPGGAHLFTVPIENRDGPTSPRVSFDSTGTLIHLEPPVYHGNPIDAKGSLVTMDWGFDIRDHIREASGCETEIILIDDISRGIRAEYLEVLLTSKPQ